MPTKEHFIFDGYFYSTDSNSKQYVDEKGNWIESWEYERDGTLYAHWHIYLPGLEWKSDFKWNNNYTIAELGLGPNNETSSKAVYDGSISKIEFPEAGNSVQMIGNGNLAGKGAAWVDNLPNYLKISKISFDYEINKGDSFIAAGLMLNVDTSDNDKLRGYLLSFNFQPSTMGASKSGSTHEFVYTIKDNTSNFVNRNQTFNSIKNNTSNFANRNQILNTDKNAIYKLADFNVGGTASKFKGHIDVKIESDKYIIEVRNSASDPNPKYTTTIEVGANNMKPNNFGFFSTHYSHYCERLGFFELKNINIEAIENLATDND